MRMKNVRFQSDKLSLHGELYLPDQAPSPAILVCHGMHAGGFRWLPLYRTFARKAAQGGFACLLFDFRGCGMSEGKFDYGWGEQRDVKAALDFLLTQNEVDRSTAFVVGRSLGGTIGLYALIDDPRVKGYALWATPPDHHQNIKSFIEKRRGRLVYVTFLLLSIADRVYDVTRLMKLDLWGIKVRPKDVKRRLMVLSGSRIAVGRKHAPILLLLGDEDEYVSPSEARMYERLLPGKRRLVILPKTGHTFNGAEEEATSITLDWFEELQGSQSR